MNFGQALEALKQGKKVQRAGWNGKGMFLALQEGTVIDKKDARGGVAKKIAESGVDKIIIHPHIDMKIADGSMSCGWRPTNPDMFCDDWSIVE